MPTIVAKAPIIGFAAYAGVGKTTAASAIINTYGFKLISFAAPIKEALRAMGLDDDEISGSKKELPCAKLGGHSPRYAMRSLGTEWGRNLISPAIWTDIWRRKVSALPPKTPIVVDDVRFQNEADAIHTMGGIVVRIMGNDGAGPRTSASQSVHPSEDQAFPADLTITNNGTMKQFMQQVKDLADAVQNGVPLDV